MMGGSKSGKTVKKAKKTENRQDMGRLEVVYHGQNGYLYHRPFWVSFKQARFLFACIWQGLFHRKWQQVLDSSPGPILKRPICANYRAKEHRPTKRNSAIYRHEGARLWFAYPKNSKAHGEPHPVIQIGCREFPLSLGVAQAIGLDYNKLKKQYPFKATRS